MAGERLEVALVGDAVPREVRRQRPGHVVRRPRGVLAEGPVEDPPELPLVQPEPLRVGPFYVAQLLHRDRRVVPRVPLHALVLGVSLEQNK